MDIVLIIFATIFVFIITVIAVSFCLVILATAKSQTSRGVDIRDYIPDGRTYTQMPNGEIRYDG